MNIDFAPTFLDFAGVKVPADMQGRSLRKVLEGDGSTPDEWREAVYYHYYEYPSWHMVKRHYGIRTQRYKLIHVYNDVNEWELYDMQQDPHEMQNVYNNPSYAAVRTQMHELMTKVQQECQDTDPQEQQHEFFKGAETL